MICKKILDSTEIDNETKIFKLVTDHELTTTIKNILNEGEVDCF